MAAKKLILDFKGLVTAAGQLAAPTGSLTTAQNVDFPAPGLAEKRRGLEAAAFGFGGACWSAISSKQLGANLLFNTGSGTAATGLQYSDGTVAYTPIAMSGVSGMENLPSTRMKAAVSLKNHYVTSNRCVGVVQSDMSGRAAGMPRPLGFAYNPIVVPVATGFLASGSGVAYRVVFGTYDADGVEIVSPPSGRFVVANVATTTGYAAVIADTTLTIYVPYRSDTKSAAVTSSWFVRLYRSWSSVVATTQPNDEMQMCFQRNLTAGDIAAGSLTVTDSCPQGALGAYLYTNTVSGGDISTGLVKAGDTSLGLLASNDRPPIAKDVALFADCLWYGNITTPYRQVVSLLAVGATAGTLQVGDILDIGGVSFTGVAGAPGANQFKVELGLGSVTLNIRQTAINICAAINLPSNGQSQVTATYIGSDASPGTIGQMLFENRVSNDSIFHLGTTGSSTCFLPDLATGIATRDTQGNGIAISKPQQGDACPPGNYLQMGPNDTTIQRLVPLRDALFIFTDGGIYWARGSMPGDFSVEMFDPTFRVTARDTVVACGDAIYAWGVEGIARITNGGVEYIDLPIRNFVESMQRGLDAAVTAASFAERAFAVSYRVKRRVVFFFPGGLETGSYACSRALVYNISTGSWATYLYQKSGEPTLNGKLSGSVRVSDELLFAGEWSSGTDTLLYVERNTNTATDYTDTGVTGADQEIATAMTWTSTAPDPAGLCQWTEAQVYLSPSDVNPLGLPSVFVVTVSSEHGGTQSSAVVPTTLQTRLMLSPAVGMASRQVMTVEHGALDEYFSLSGFALLYHPMSNFNTR